MEELIKKVAKKADDQLNFKRIVPGLGGVILEFLDGKILEIGLKYAIEKLPNEYHDELAILMEAYVSGDYSKVKIESVRRLNQIINIPVLDEAEEEIILNANITAFFNIVERRKVKLDLQADGGSVGGGGQGGDPGGGNGGG